MSDAVGSIGVIIGAIVIYFTQWVWIDTLIAVLIGFWVLPRTWILLKQSINILLEGVPEEIDIEKDGKDILIGFNPKFLIDALKVIDDEVIHMYLMNPKAPCFIRDDEENYTYLILPVNISQNQNR